MFKFTVTTARPNTNAPFFPFTSLGQTYDALVTAARAARPTSGPDALIGYSRVESPDGLTLTTEYSFVSVAGKDAFFEDVNARSTANGLVEGPVARGTYNTSVGHASAVTFAKVE
jgi:hypothetical protein